ncbi:MAG: transglutaminase-like domain-containing protein [Gemmatimonadaceae bacterium]
MTRRAKIACGVIAIWAVGLGLLVRRELGRGAGERLAQAALMVVPGAEFYSVSQRGRQIGFATSTVDTTSNGVSVADLFVADLVADNAVHRASARLMVRMSRALRLKSFVFELGPEMGALKATGEIVDDSTLRLFIATLGEKADTQQIRFAGPLLLPTVVPLALVLGEQPKVGRRYAFSVFDPTAMKAVRVALRVLAESTFVVSDSAVFDSVRTRWRAIHYDTLKAWHIEPDSGSSAAGMLSGWVDRHGRMVQSTQFGTFALLRGSYEMAYKNWAMDRKSGVVAGGAEDIQELTAIASGVPIEHKREVSLLRLRLHNSDLTGYELGGSRQTLRHDTLEIRRETTAELTPAYQLPNRDPAMRGYLLPQPLIQSDNPQVIEVSMRIRSAKDIGKRYRRMDRDPSAVARALNEYVFRTLDKKVSLTMPNALAVLHRKSGDCNEHTVLFIALARASGLPARSAAGLVYVGGKFYYHAWPEVYLGAWVPVDPTFGQFPADASHIRFVTGDYFRQAELLKLVGALQIDVLSAETPSATTTSPSPATR